MKNLIINYVYNDHVTNIDIGEQNSYWYTTIA